jgi:hypothetical protein
MRWPTLQPGFWRQAFFYMATAVLMGMLIWQLGLLEPPDKWCPAKSLSICYAGLIENLHIRDHAIIGLLAVQGIVVIGGMVVNYGLRVSAAGGTDGVHVDVAQDRTTITTPATTVSVPTTPPANGA